MYYVYILTNKSHTTLYTGVTNNLTRRFFEHLGNKPGSFTAKYRINQLVFFETYDDIADAVSAEKLIKGKTRAWKISLIESMNKEWRNLME